MAHDWQEVVLGGVCLKIGSGATPRGGKSVYLDEGEYTLIRSQNVYNDGFHHDGLAYITEQHAEQLKNVAVEEGDVLLNITGDSVARCCQVDPSVLPARVNQHVAIIRPDASILHSRFLRYFLVSPQKQSLMLSWAGAGGTRNALTKGMIESFKVPCPSRDEQKAIACILGTLDDKIEENQRMNKALEAMVSATFKSWFVDFDPVIENALAANKPIPDAFSQRIGRLKATPTGLPHVVRQNFPGVFIGSGLGPIPAGWTASSLNQLKNFFLGGDWGKDEYAEGFTEEVYCIRGADIPSLQSGGLGSMPTRFVKASSLHKRSLQVGDIVFEISGGSPTQSTGRSVLITDEFVTRLDLPVVCSNFCRMIRLTKAETAPFVYFWLRWLYSTNQFLQYENGTTGIKNLAFTAFSEEHPLLIPSEKVLDAFLKLSVPLVERRDSSGAENDMLAAIRDALLPKLISGELEITDAERIAGRAL